MSKWVKKYRGPNLDVLASCLITTFPASFDPSFTLFFTMLHILKGLGPWATADGHWILLSKSQTRQTRHTIQTVGTMAIGRCAVLECSLLNILYNALYLIFIFQSDYFLTYLRCVLTTSNDCRRSIFGPAGRGNLILYAVYAAKHCASMCQDSKKGCHCKAIATTHSLSDRFSQLFVCWKHQSPKSYSTQDIPRLRWQLPRECILRLRYFQARSSKPKLCLNSPLGFDSRTKRYLASCIKSSWASFFIPLII